MEPPDRTSEIPRCGETLKVGLLIASHRVQLRPGLHLSGKFEIADDIHDPGAAEN